MDFDLVEPFETDDGELAQVSPAESFALGVEWVMFRARLVAGGRFTDLVMASNASRCVRMAERHGRFVEHRDVAEGWCGITVGDRVQ